jgi:hypothetical protein
MRLGRNYTEKFNTEDLELNTLVTLNNNDDENYCCICLNTENDKYVSLQCCNKTIHYECIMVWMITKNNINYKCPICRKQIQLNDSVTLGNLIDYINTKQQVITKTRMYELIRNLYSNTYISNTLSEQNLISH